MSTGDMHQTFFKSNIRPAALARADRRKARQSVDEKESAKVRIRSGGRCEVFYGEWWRCEPDTLRAGVRFSRASATRCQRRACEVHHMIGGRGKRGRGISALAAHKQHVCDPCHLGITGDIGGKRLKRIGEVVPYWTDTYERVK